MQTTASCNIHVARIVCIWVNDGA